MHPELLADVIKTCRHNVASDTPQDVNLGSLEAAVVQLADNLEQAGITKDEKQVADLILSDPDGGRMVISSELRHEADGAMRFTVTNPWTGRRFGVHLGLAELTPQPAA